MSKPRFLLILVDGLADVTSSALSNKTPLEALTLPHFNSIAKGGINGLLDPVEPGLACGSDTAHLSILEYDPRIYYRGRGAFETMGAGVHMEPGDIAFKSNFATLDSTTPSDTDKKRKTEGRIVVKRRADRHFEELGPKLCDLLDGMTLPSYPDHKVVVKYATEHRCGVLVRGPNLTDRISGTDPLKDKLPLLKAQPLDDSFESRFTAELVNELSEEIHLKLTGHSINQKRIAEGKNPADVVLLRGCGTRLQVQPFSEKHGLRPFFIAPTAIIAGLAMSLDIDVIKSPGGTGDYYTDLNSKAETALKHLCLPSSDPKAYDFGFLHVKAVDDAAHDRNMKVKLFFLEQIDKMLEKLIVGLKAHEQETGQKFIIVLTGDHSTPTEFGEHSYEPVPFSCAYIEDIDLPNQLTQKRSFRSDNVDQFSEISARDGVLGRFPGSQVMQILKNFRTLQ